MSYYRSVNIILLLLLIFNYYLTLINILMMCKEIVNILSVLFTVNLKAGFTREILRIIIIRTMYFLILAIAVQE